MKANTMYNEVPVSTCELCGIEMLGSMTVCLDCQRDVRESEEAQMIADLEISFGKPGEIWWFDASELDCRDAFGYAPEYLPATDPRLLTRLSTEDSCGW